MFSKYKFYIIGAVIVTVGVISFLVWRKRKNKKEMENSTSETASIDLSSETPEKFNESKARHLANAN